MSVKDFEYRINRAWWNEQREVAANMSLGELLERYAARPNVYYAPLIKALLAENEQLRSKVPNRDDLRRVCDVAWQFAEKRMDGEAAARLRATLED